MRTEIREDRRIGDRREDVLTARLWRTNIGDGSCRRIDERRVSKDVRPDGHVVVYAKRGN